MAKTTCELMGLENHPLNTAKWEEPKQLLPPQESQTSDSDSELSKSEDKSTDRITPQKRSKSEPTHYSGDDTSPSQSRRVIRFDTDSSVDYDTYSDTSCFERDKCNGVHFAEGGYQNNHAGKSVVYKGFLRGTRARLTITKNRQGKLTLKKGFFTNTRAKWRGDGEMFPDFKAIIHRQRLPFANTLRTFRFYKAAKHHVDHECHVHNDNATQPLLQQK